MKYKLVIFDLDGTILNTLEDLADSVNYALSTNGYPVRSIEEVRQFVGNGIRKLVERAVPSEISLEQVNQVFDTFVSYYKEHSADKTRPYDGILKLLNQIKMTGRKMAVVSNKADDAVQRLCQDYFPGIFDFVLGERKEIPRKPAPNGVHKVLEELKMDGSDAVYIGDSEVDIETARNAHLDNILVSWGFRDKEFLLERGAMLILKHPYEILEHI